MTVGRRRNAQDLPVACRSFTVTVKVLPVVARATASVTESPGFFAAIADASVLWLVTDLLSTFVITSPF